MCKRSRRGADNPRRSACEFYFEESEFIMCSKGVLARVLRFFYPTLPAGPQWLQESVGGAHTNTRTLLHWAQILVQNRVVESRARLRGEMLPRKARRWKSLSLARQTCDTSLACVGSACSPPHVALAILPLHGQAIHKVIWLLRSSDTMLLRLDHRPPLTLDA